MTTHKIVKTVLAMCLSLFLAQNVFAQDWPNLKRYYDANRAQNDNTVKAVFMGDSITDFWMRYSADFFKDNDYVDRGINGQTSPQMLLRFQQDVVSLKPKAVVILAGTNDLASLTGPSTLEMIEDNIRSMTELSKAHRIRVILCSLLPVTNGKGGRTPDKILAVNAWLKDYAQKSNCYYLNYYAAIVDNQNNFRAEYTYDGLHPNKAGYQVMEELVEALIKKIL